MNVDYEIPLVYVNGTPLIDSINEMGIPITTNFYTNPLNVTIEVKQSFSGSVQVKRIIYRGCVINQQSSGNIKIYSIANHLICILVLVATRHGGSRSIRDGNGERQEQEHLRHQQLSAEQQLDHAGQCRF